MFALVVAVEEGLGDGGGGGVEEAGVPGEVGYVFKDDGVVGGVGGGAAPGEGGVVGDEDSGDGEGVEFRLLEMSGDGNARVEDVVFGALLVGQRGGAGDGGRGSSRRGWFRRGGWGRAAWAQVVA